MGRNNYGCQEDAKRDENASLHMQLLQQFYRPFKVVYSGALPAQPRSKNVVLRPDRNRGNWLYADGLIAFS